jgi:hypothetical protein
VIGLLRGIFEAVITMLVLRFVMRLFTPAPPSRQAGHTHAGPAPRGERVGGTLVRDPHCGTYIPQSKAIHVGQGSSALYFCSAACRDAYAAAHAR